MTYARADVIFSDFSCLNAKTMLRKGLVRGLSDFRQTFIESTISFLSQPQICLICAICGQYRKISARPYSQANKESSEM